MADDLFGVEQKKPEPKKPLAFEFKSTKGNSVKISYKPSGDVNVTDKKAFEGYLKRVADSFEIVEKKEEKPKPKTLDAVLESEDKNEDTEL